MKTLILNMLSESNIKTTGLYSNLPSIIEDAIETVKLFGFDYWNNETTVSNTIKNIVKQLSK